MPRFLLRHCHATGQAPDAALSETGLAQAARLPAALADLPITAVVASPWARAVASAGPIALARGLPVTTDARLTEYVLAPRPRDDWREQLRANFHDPTRTLDGGESLHAAAERLAAVLSALPDGALVVTHGGLLSAYARSLDAAFGFPFWEALRTPALLAVDTAGLRELPIPT